MDDPEIWRAIYRMTIVAEKMHGARMDGPLEDAARKLKEAAEKRKRELEKKAKELEAAAKKKVSTLVDDGKGIINKAAAEAAEKLLKTPK
jgi:hypothetical protein